MKYLVILCALIVGCGGGGGPDRSDKRDGSDSVSDCFQEVIDDRDQCWIDEAYVFAGDECVNFSEYYIELSERRPEAFDACAAIQDEMAECSRATEKEAARCKEVFNHKIDRCPYASEEDCLNRATRAEWECLYDFAFTDGVRNW